MVKKVIIVSVHAYISLCLEQVTRGYFIIHLFTSEGTEVELDNNENKSWRTYGKHLDLFI